MLIGPVAVRANRVAPPRGPQVSMNTCQRRLLQLTHHDEESRNGSTVRQRRLWPRGEAVRSYKRARMLRITSRPALLLKRMLLAPLLSSISEACPSLRRHQLNLTATPAINGPRKTSSQFSAPNPR